MKRWLPCFMACVLILAMFAGCGGGAAPADSSASTAAPASSGAAVAATEAAADASGLVDGKFTETRQITVEIYDRATDGQSDPVSNKFAEYIKAGLLEDHNIEVTFQIVPRWTEVEVINNLLAANDAPDVCYTYNLPTIETYAAMGGVHDLDPLLTENKDKLPALWDLLGDELLYWTKDPATGKLWNIMARMTINNGGRTFVREDWLAKLGLSAPATTEEFEAMLVAFRDNAAELLGDNAAQMIPLRLEHQVGFSVRDLVHSFLPDGISDRDLYTYMRGDDLFLLPESKEAYRLVNKWYNDDLIWKDYPLYDTGDTTGADLVKAGYVGAFMQNWDVPYRDGEEGLQVNMQNQVGPEAAYIPIQAFKNSAGKPFYLMPPSTDRHIFLPATNEEPVASLMYLNWISDIENSKYLQIGDPGVNHEDMGDGKVKMLTATGPDIINSVNNIDYTMTMNGMRLDTPEALVGSIAFNYPGIDPKYIEMAFDQSYLDVRQIKSYKCGIIAAEEGTGPALEDKRDTFLTQAIVAPVDQFDATYDAGMDDYLVSGGQAIIDERAAAWQTVHGDTLNLE